jgi:hypothetical protein
MSLPSPAPIPLPLIHTQNSNFDIRPTCDDDAPNSNGRYPPESYHASLPTRPFGQPLTKNFLASSRSKSPSPSAIGRSQCSTGTDVVPKIGCRGGMYNQKKAMPSAKSMAGNR